jgi:hypothetical protein
VNGIVKTTINSVKKRTTSYKNTNIAEGNILLELDVTIQNNDKNNDFAYSDSSFIISSGSNTNSSTARTTQFAKGMINPFIGSSIPPGSIKEGIIAFIVPESPDYTLSVVDASGAIVSTVNNIKVA